MMLSLMLLIVDFDADTTSKVLLLFLLLFSPLGDCSPVCPPSSIAEAVVFKIGGIGRLGGQKAMIVRQRT